MARKWTDRHGTQHTVEIDVPAAMRLRDECDVDLLKCLSDPDAFQPVVQQLHADPVLTISCLAVIADVSDSDPEDFGRLFDGQALSGGTDALLEAIIDFFQEPQRTILRRLLERTEQHVSNVRVASTAKALAAVDSLDFDLVLSSSPTRGSGSNESSESLTPTAEG